MGIVDSRRGDLYAGLYDPPPASATPRRVRLLNPLSVDDDPTSRRFALLEIE